MSHDIHAPCTSCGDENHAAIDCTDGQDICFGCGDAIQWDSTKLACSCQIREVS
jgi:hypothetical protein